jgi:hypothetical protein
MVDVESEIPDFLPGQDGLGRDESRRSSPPDQYGREGVVRRVAELREREMDKKAKHVCTDLSGDEDSRNFLNFTRRSSSRAGSIRQLPAFMKSLGISRVLIVTDKGLMSLRLLDGLFDGLKEAGIAYRLYDGVQPNPTIPNIEEAVRLYLADQCQAIIAFGGGSSMDCAKGAGARVVTRENIPACGDCQVTRSCPAFALRHRWHRIRSTLPQSSPTLPPTRNTPSTIPGSSAYAVQDPD